MPGYTRFVGWKQRISLLVLVVLTALPLSGTVCAMVCDSNAKAGSGHHGSDKKCEDPAQPSTGAQIQGVSEHDCSDHDGAARQVATTVGERILLQAHPAPSADFAALTIFTSLAASGHSFAYTGPPGTAPPPTTPLVLRI